jgi:hypothetical protein
MLSHWDNTSSCTFWGRCVEVVDATRGPHNAILSAPRSRVLTPRT